MSHTRYRVVHSSLGVCLLAALVLTGCGDEIGFRPALASTGQLDISECRASNSGDVEVVYLGWYGGSSFHTAQYRLFGDGRLLREIVLKSERNKPLRIDEVKVAESDLRLIRKAIVRGHLTTMTPDRLQESMEGQELLYPEDGSTAQLRVRFAACNSNAGRIEPFSTSISMPSPRIQAERFPQVREIQAFLTVVDALEAYFPESVFDALRKVRKGKPG